MMFTHDCAGDLGLRVNGSIVAIFFQHTTSYSVHDIRKGGHPTIYRTLADALNAMLKIAEDLQ